MLLGTLHDFGLAKLMGASLQSRVVMVEAIIGIVSNPQSVEKCGCMRIAKTAN